MSLDQKNKKQNNPIVVVESMGKDVFNYRPYKSSPKIKFDQEIDLLQKNHIIFWQFEFVYLKSCSKEKNFNVSKVKNYMINKYKYFYN